MSTTTIKVPSQLRERVQRHAQREHVSQATVIERALDLLDREAFFTQLCRDVAERPEDATECDERNAWLAGPVAVIRDGAYE
ncbi:MAG: ribbon-helix-helix protein, CopG family [Nocardioidaceae bacterium]